MKFILWILLRMSIFYAITMDKLQWFHFILCEGPEIGIVHTVMTVEIVTSWFKVSNSS